MSYSNSNTILCPCGANLAYANCCGIFHTGPAFAPTPEKLMRSRYSAYVLLLENYLLQTWHASTKPPSLDLIHENLTKPRKWLGLKIIQAQQNSLDKGKVEFIAKYKIGGKAYQLHEISDFVLENNHWLYVAGSFPNSPQKIKKENKKRKYKST